MQIHEAGVAGASMTVVVTRLVGPGREHVLLRNAQAHGCKDFAWPAPTKR